MKQLKNDVIHKKERCNETFTNYTTIKSGENG